MTHPIAKFFDENRVSTQHERYADVELQRGMFVTTAELFGSDLRAHVEVTGSHVVEGVRLPIVKYTLPNKAICVIHGDFNRIRVFFTGSNAVDPDKLRDMGLDNYNVDRDKILASIGSVIQLSEFLRYVNAVNNPERRLTPNGPTEASVYKL